MTPIHSTCNHISPREINHITRPVHAAVQDCEQARPINGMWRVGSRETTVNTSHPGLGRFTLSNLHV